MYLFTTHIGTSINVGECVFNVTWVFFYLWGISMFMLFQRLGHFCVLDILIFWGYPLFGGYFDVWVFLLLLCFDVWSVLTFDFFVWGISRFWVFWPLRYFDVMHISTFWVFRYLGCFDVFFHVWGILTLVVFWCLVYFNVWGILTIRVSQFWGILLFGAFWCLEFFYFGVFQCFGCLNIFWYFDVLCILSFGVF